MSKLLSILIPTLPSRLDSYLKIVRKINYQITLNGFEDKVQILSLMDTKEMSVGEKRNRLIEMASGKYIMFVDDDDDVAQNFVIEILKGIDSGADAVTFRGRYYENGIYVGMFLFSRKVLVDSDSGGIMYRRINHLCAVKRDIAIDCKFPDKNCFEDSEYAGLLLSKLQTEHFINQELYHYFFDKVKTETQK